MADRTSINAALKRLRQRLEAEQRVQELLPTLQDVRSSLPSRDDLEQQERYAREMAELVQNLRDSGRTSFADYVFGVSFWIGSRIHEARWLAGKYEELEPISQRLDAVKKEHGLELGETWLRDQGPAEWTALNREYEETLDSKLAPTLREFGFDDLADLLEQDPRRFHELKVLGRRGVFDPPSEESRLRQLEDRFRNEADSAEAAGAYYAAAALRGAVLEAALLRMVLDRSEDAQGAVARLEPRFRPRGTDPLRWGLADLLSVAAAAGWLPSLDIGDAVVDVQEFAAFARGMRNLLHPGRHLGLPPDWTVEESEAADFQALLLIVEWLLQNVGRNQG